MSMEITEEGLILKIHIPMQLRRRGGRKVIITPGGDTAAKNEAAIHEDPVVRALAKARRWQTMLESGQAATIGDLAVQEKVDASYMARTMRLNALAPDIVEVILRGDYPDTISLESLRPGIPVDWEEQRQRYGLVQ